MASPVYSSDFMNRCFNWFQCMHGDSSSWIRFLLLQPILVHEFDFCLFKCFPLIEVIPVFELGTVCSSDFGLCKLIESMNPISVSSSDSSSWIWFLFTQMVLVHEFDSNAFKWFYFSNRLLFSKGIPAHSGDSSSWIWFCWIKCSQFPQAILVPEFDFCLFKRF